MSAKRNAQGLVPTAVLIALVCWLLWAYSLQSDDFVAKPVAEALSSFLGLRYSSLPTALVGLITTIVGVWITRRYMLLSIRGQAIFFLLSILFLSSNPYWMIWEYFTPVLLLLILSFVPLFEAYNRSRASLLLLDSGLLVGSSALLWSPTLLLIPLFVWHMHTLRTLSLRTVLSFVVGVITPLWLLSPFLYFFGHKAYLMKQLALLTDFGFPLSSINTYDYTLLMGCLVVPALLLVIGTLSAIHLSLSYWQEKVHSRTLLYTLTHSVFYALALSLVSGEEGIGFQYLSIFPIAILMARTLSQHKGRSFVLLLSVVITLFLTAFALSLFL